LFLFFFQAEDGIRDKLVTGVQTCALPIFMATRTGASAFGRMCRQMTRNPVAPTFCDQTTNSRSFSERNSARTSRVTPIHPVSPRSEERRVGKECRSRGGECDEKR